MCSSDLEEPENAGGSAVLARDAQSECGTSVKVYQYNDNVSSEPQEAGQIVTEMEANRNTTVIMLTDPVMVQYMTASAASANYFPEWLYTVLPNSLAREANSTEMKSAMELNPWEPLVGSPQSRLCYRIYKRADPRGVPESSASGLDTVCSTLLAIFGGLQAAGPDLTATNFERGWFSLPPSTGTSDFGRWSFGADQFSPVSTFSVTWWDGSVTSKYDGGKGEFAPCTGLIDKPYLRPSLGSGQPTCFGH